ncbi:MAG: TlpA family protein disulfide reductase [Candidatus Kryptoniota bacterium]
MNPREQARAPMISGINVMGENVDVEYSTNLVNILLFFDPVSKISLESLDMVQLILQRYENLSVGFWYVMEPRLSCMYRGNIARAALERLGLSATAIFDANGMIVLRTGIKVVPAALVVDSNSFIKSQYEGEISFREIERSIQARLALSGYREDLPTVGWMEFPISHLHGGSVMRQLGYATGDYLFTSLVVPESDQQFSLPDFCLPETIYPCGAWFVGRDFIEGRTGSTVYISCSKDESVHIFAGSEENAAVKIHTSIELDQHVILGKDVTSDGSSIGMAINEFRSYEVLAASGDADVLISLQVNSGAVKLYCVEYCHNPLVHITY